MYWFRGLKRRLDHGKVSNWVDYMIPIAIDRLAALLPEQSRILESRESTVPSQAYPVLSIPLLDDALASVEVKSLGYSTPAH